MEPVARGSYTLSEKDMMDKANKFLSDARLILEGKLEVKDAYYGMPLPVLDSLNKALTMAQEGFDITRTYRPGAETVITVIGEIEEKIKELEKPPEPIPEPVLEPESISEPVLESESKSIPEPAPESEPEKTPPKKKRGKRKKVK